jgi:hypothetical protein
VHLEFKPNQKISLFCELLVEGGREGKGGGAQVKSNNNRWW